MEEKNKKSPIAMLLSLSAKLIALIMIIRYAVLIVHTYYPFLPTTGIVVDILAYLDAYAPLILMVVVALEAVWDKSDVLKLIFLIICVAIIIFSFFPNIRTTIEQYTGIA